MKLGHLPIRGRWTTGQARKDRGFLQGGVSVNKSHSSPGALECIRIDPHFVLFNFWYLADFLLISPKNECVLQQHSLALSTLPGLVANCGESTNNVGDVYRINSIDAKAQLDIFIKTKYELERQKDLSWFRKSPVSATENKVSLSRFVRKSSSSLLWGSPSSITESQPSSVTESQVDIFSLRITVQHYRKSTVQHYRKSSKYLLWGSPSSITCLFNRGGEGERRGLFAAVLNLDLAKNTVKLHPMTPL